MPWHIEDAARERRANYIQGGRFKAFAVRDGRLITGQQQPSGAATARMAVRAGHRCAGYVPGDGSRGLPCGYRVDGNRRWQKRSSCRRVEVRGWPIRVGDAVHGGLAVMVHAAGPSGAAKNGRPQKPSTLPWAPAWRWTGASGTLPLHFGFYTPRP
jgi:hypothetical protein